MIRVAVTLLDELEDNSYVAYSEPGNLLEVMTEVYKTVNKRIEENDWTKEIDLNMVDIPSGVEGVSLQVGPADAVPSFTCEPVVKRSLDESGSGDSEAGPYDSFVGLQRLPKKDGGHS